MWRTCFFRASGGNHTCHFFHQEKTAGTPECDKRVDGRSNLSLSQRVGLPVFLTRSIADQYHLSIGFPPLGLELLSKAELAHFTVGITSGGKTREISVDRTNFIDNAITLIPVSFIPGYWSNYRITLKGKKMISGIQRKWSDYADGFSISGAIFNFDELSGKKVRRGDSISTSREYYVVTSLKSIPYPEIKLQEIGSLNGQSYRPIKFIAPSLTISFPLSFLRNN